MAITIESLDGSRARTRSNLGLQETEEGLVIISSSKRSQENLKRWQNQWVIRVVGQGIKINGLTTAVEGLHAINFNPAVKLTKVILDYKTQ